MLSRSLLLLPHLRALSLARPAMATFASAPPVTAAAKVLGLSQEDALDTSIIRARFITLAKLYHPDLSSPQASASKFSSLREAFELLLSSSTSAPSAADQEALSNFDDWFRRHCFDASSETLNEMADAGANLAPGGLDKGGMWELAQRVASEEAHRKEKEAQATLAASATPMADAITSKLTSSFSPSFLQVLNESHMHNVPKNSETHFKVVVVSDSFLDKKPLERHKMVNGVLKDELAGTVHALSIVAKTPAQFEKLGGASKYLVPPSPSCRGGDGSLPPKNPK
mmetsp:Transcript_30171/g.59935  ORF Transcript_30171/g.59935 Transcript_30171/m.59935 type:complete len:284 (-) Transcript_30171:10-861(-)